MHRELHGNQCARKEFKTLKPEGFSPYRRSAAVESLELEPLQPPNNSDAMYAVVTASPELVYTRPCSFLPCTGQGRKEHGEEGRKLEEGRKEECTLSNIFRGHCRTRHP